MTLPPPEFFDSSGGFGDCAASRGENWHDYEADSSSPPSSSDQASHPPRLGRYQGGGLSNAGVSGLYDDEDDEGNETDWMNRKSVIKFENVGEEDEEELDREVRSFLMIFACSIVQNVARGLY